MEIHATLTQVVNIDPICVIKKLKDLEIGEKSWVFEKNGKYYRGFEVSAGTHSFDDEEEISKAKYNYIIALELVLENLNKPK